MLLSQLAIGEMAVIDAIHVEGTLKDRLCSLGLTRNEAISIKHCGWFKSTIQVMTESSLIALRREEAACIEVHKVA